MAKLFEYFNTLDAYYNWAGYNGVGIMKYLGQTFTVISNHNITSIKLKLFKSSTANRTPGICTISIRTIDINGWPTANILCSGTTDGDTLTTDVLGEWREIIFSPPLSAIIGTVYAIVILAQDATYDRRVYWRYASSGVPPSHYLGGGYCGSNDNGVTWIFSDPDRLDFMFEVYGPASKRQRGRYQGTALNTSRRNR